jgi:hypothetical protein
MKKLSKIQLIKLLYNLYSLFKIWKGIGMKALLSSKKALATISGVLIIVLVNIVGLPEASAITITEAIIKLIGILVGVQGTVDIAKAIKGSGK